LNNFDIRGKPDVNRRSIATFHTRHGIPALHLRLVVLRSLSILTVLGGLPSGFTGKVAYRQQGELKQENRNVVN
jgi:hypothetical protein